MGLFGIKTRKEKQREAAEKAREIAKLLEEVETWDRKKCEKEKNNSKYPSEVRRAIDKRATKLFLEMKDNNKRNKIYALEQQFRAKEAEISRIENDKSIRWNNSYSNGYRLGTADLTGQIAEDKGRISMLRREISNLRCQIRDLENNPFI